MRFKMIVATDEVNGIGKNNTLPWKCPEDLKYFSKKTKGESVFLNAVIMGRNTYESIGKALPDRVNYVLSKTLAEKEKEEEEKEEKEEEKEEQEKRDNSPADLFFFDNYKSLLEEINSKVFNEIWVIGGEKIYKLFLELDLVSEIYITRIKGKYECDAFFPELDGAKYGNKFKKTMTTKGKNIGNNNNILEFAVYTRVS